MLNPVSSDFPSSSTSSHYSTTLTDKPPNKNFKLLQSTSKTNIQVPPCSPKPQSFPCSSQAALSRHPPARQVQSSSRGVQIGRKANARPTSILTVSPKTPAIQTKTATQF